MQSMISSIFALKALKNLGIKPKRTIALCFVADEEQGSKYGIEYLIKQGVFKKDDLILVPDGGNGDGSFFEIAEKAHCGSGYARLGSKLTQADQRTD